VAALDRAQELLPFGRAYHPAVVAVVAHLRTGYWSIETSTVPLTLDLGPTPLGDQTAKHP